MKWKKLTRESVNDAADELGGLEEPVRIIDVDEIRPESDVYGSLASDAQFLIDEYIGSQAKKYYTNGHIPEDEEEAIRDSLAAVYVEFEYWAEEDEDNYAGYEEGQTMFIIDRDDGSICGIDKFRNDYPDDVLDFVKGVACEHIGVKVGSDRSPRY